MGLSFEIEQTFGIAGDRRADVSSAPDRSGKQEADETSALRIFEEENLLVSKKRYYFQSRAANLRATSSTLARELNAEMRK